MYMNQEHYPMNTCVNPFRPIPTNLYSPVAAKMNFNKITKTKNKQLSVSIKTKTETKKYKTCTQHLQWTASKTITTTSTKECQNKRKPNYLAEKSCGECRIPSIYTPLKGTPPHYIF